MPTGVVIAGILPLVLVALIPLASTRPPHKSCPECGYDLRGLLPTNPCPECGRPPGPAPRPWLPLIAVLPLAVGTGAAMVFFLAGWSDPRGAALVFAPFALLTIISLVIYFIALPGALIGFVAVGLSIATALITRAGYQFAAGLPHDQASSYAVNAIILALFGAPALAAAGALLASLAERMTQR